MTRVFSSGSQDYDEREVQKKCGWFETSNDSCSVASHGVKRVPVPLLRDYADRRCYIF